MFPLPDNDVHEIIQHANIDMPHVREHTELLESGKTLMNNA